MKFHPNVPDRVMCFMTFIFFSIKGRRAGDQWSLPEYYEKNLINY